MNFRRLAPKCPGRQGLGGWVKLPAEAIRPTDDLNDDRVKRQALVVNGAISWHFNSLTLSLLSFCHTPCRGLVKVSCSSRWWTKQ